MISVITDPETVPRVPGVIAEEGNESGQRGEWRWGRRVFEGPGARAVDRGR
ncbi:MAG: hypothetical protein ACI8WY_002228, partial [Planctomycetota bacterium]